MWRLTTACAVNPSMKYGRVKNTHSPLILGHHSCNVFGERSQTIALSALDRAQICSTTIRTLIASEEPLNRFLPDRALDPQLLKTLRSSFEPKSPLHAAVVGSRPNVEMSDPRLQAASLVISANAAASRTPEPPNIAVLDYRHVRPATSRLTEESQRLLSRREFKTVLAVQSNSTEATFSVPLWLNCARLLDCDIRARGAIVRRAVGMPHFPVGPDFLVSTGVFAACLAVLLGAETLHLHGFSIFSLHPRTMHFYDDADSDWQIGTEARPHSRADAATIALLSRRLSMTSDSWDISGLLRNWV